MENKPPLKKFSFVLTITYGSLIYIILFNNNNKTKQTIQ